jgi:L-seryl-tRNA(Ser) seleniumtransferase
MRMIAASRDEIEVRAAALAPVLRAAGFTAELVEGFSTIGGGSAPGSTLPTVLLAISRPGVSPDALESQLRQLPTPVIARIENDRVVLDLRTVLENQDALLLDSDFWILDA